MYELYAFTDVRTMTYAHMCTETCIHTHLCMYVCMYVHPVCAQAEHACYLQSSASDELVAGSASDSKRPAVAGFTVRVVFPARDSDRQ